MAEADSLGPSEATTSFFRGTDFSAEAEMALSFISGITGVITIGGGDGGGALTPSEP